MPQPVSYNPGTPVSGSIQENNISYVVDGQNRNYRGGFGGLSWMSEVPAENNVIFIGNSTSLGRGPANIPLFYPAYNNSSANIVYAANTLPGSPRNFTTTGSAYNWAVTNNFFINNSNNPIPRIDADGLVLYVDASQPTSYPQTGTTWYDLSGTGYNSTLTNGPAFDSNGWFQFDGVDDYSIGNGALGSDCTVELWISSSNYSQTIPISIDGDNYGSGPNVYFTGNIIAWNTGDGGNNAFSNSSYPNAQWHHIVVTNDYNITAKLYIDGKLIGTANPLDATTVFGSNKFWIGRFHGGGYNIASLINSAKIYTQALTEAQVKQNYFQGNIVTGSLVFMVDANNLVSYPKSGTTLYNLTGSQTGTLTNGVGYSSNNGGYWTFDGVDDYIAVSSPQTLNPGTSSFTIEFWCLISSALPDAGYSCALEARSTSNLYGFISVAYWSGGYMGLFVNGDGDPGQNVYISTTTPVQKNTWVHQSMIVDRTTQQIIFYYNGVQTGNKVNLTDTGSLDPGSGYVYYIGGDLGGNEMNGNIASLRQYNKALTPDEVQQNYQATKDKFLGQQIVTNGLVLNLDAANKDSYPGTGTTWYDLSGNNYNATVESSVSFSSTYNGGLTTLNDATNANQKIYGTFSLSSANYTWEIWYTNNGSQGGDASGFGVTDASGVSSNGFRANSDSSVQQWVGGSLTVGQTISTASTPKQVVLRRSGTTFNSFSNGVLIDTDTAASTSATFINYSMNCSGCTSSNNGWNGTYYIVRMYNRALSDAEILQNYNSQKTRLGL